MIETGVRIRAGVIRRAAIQPGRGGSNADRNADGSLATGDPGRPRGARNKTSPGGDGAAGGETHV